jgi:hypothetical protein
VEDEEGRKRERGIDERRFFFSLIPFSEIFSSLLTLRERERASTSCVMRCVDVIQCGAFSGANVRVTNVYNAVVPHSPSHPPTFSFSLSLSIYPSILKRNLMMIEFKLLL